MEYRETRGISIERIRDFFSAQEGAVRDDETHFRVGGASVSLSRLPDNPVFSVPMPRTEVVITGPGESAENVHRLFFMRFLSAGG